MANWLNLGEMLKVNARKYPQVVCLMDAERSFTFPQTNARVNRLAHGLMALGLSKGDKVSALLENCIEFVELYLAAAKCGLVLNPINFRLVGAEIATIVNHADSKAFVVHDEFCPTVDAIRGQLGAIGSEGFICVGQTVDGFRPFEDLPVVLAGHGKHLLVGVPLGPGRPVGGVDIGAADRRRELNGLLHIPHRQRGSQRAGDRVGRVDLGGLQSHRIHVPAQLDGIGIERNGRGKTQSLHEFLPVHHAEFDVLQPEPPRRLTGLLERTAQATPVVGMHAQMDHDPSPLFAP